MDRYRLKKLIIPLALEQLLTVSVGIIDTFMVSTVGEAAVGGVALVDTLNLLIIQVMAAFAAGGIVVISQYIGERDEDMVRSSQAQLELLIGAFSIGVTVCIILFGKSILRALFGSLSDDIMQASVTYMMITGLSFIFWGLYTSGAAILRCHEDTSTSMKISLVMNLMNVVLNAVFIINMQMGVMGVALATLISRAAAGITMKAVTMRHKDVPRLAFTDYRLSPGVMKRILAMGVPSGIENGMFHIGKLMVATMVATLGTYAIAANSIAYQIIEFPNIPGNTIGLALVVIIGQDIGADDKEGAVRDTKFLIKCAYIADWVCKILLFITAPVIVSAFGLSAETNDIAVLVLRCFSVASLAIWPLSFTMPSALRGAGDVNYSMIASIIAMWLGRVAASYVLVMVFNLGILGVWIGMFVDWYIRGISYLLRFKSRRWLNKKVV